jgi:hypothetical protein
MKKGKKVEVVFYHLFVYGILEFLVTRGPPHTPEKNSTFVHFFLKQIGVGGC